MKGLFRRLFGGEPNVEGEPIGVAHPAPPETVPNPLAEDVRARASEYFQVVQEMERFRKAGRWAEVGALIRSRFGVFLAFLSNSLDEFGDVPQVLPFLTIGTRAFVVTDDKEGLDRLRRTVEGSPVLEAYREHVEMAYTDFDRARALERMAAERPGILQTEARDALGVEGQELSFLARRLDEAGRLRRVRSGRTYALYPPVQDE